MYAAAAVTLRRAQREADVAIDVMLATVGKERVVVNRGDDVVAGGRACIREDAAAYPASTHFFSRGGGSKKHAFLAVRCPSSRVPPFPAAETDQPTT